MTTTLDPASVYEPYGGIETLRSDLFAGRNTMDPKAAALVDQGMQFLGLMGDDGNNVNYWTTLLQHLGQSNKLLNRTPGSSQAHYVDLNKQSLKEYYLAKDIAQGLISRDQAYDILRAYDAQQRLDSSQRLLQNDKNR
ncbi:hypothetical protein EBZ39_15645, partial [bacterium]|nr:hypothetical protein [bacterium]